MKMKSPLSPSDIEVLLHCHTTPEPHPRANAPAVRDALEMFDSADMIKPQWLNPQTIECYRTTPKGDAFIEALLHTPEPVQTWTVPKGE